MAETRPQPTDSALLQLLMEALPDRIYFKDLDSRFVRVNRAHARWLGVASPEEAVGKTDADFFASVHAEAALAEERAIISTGEPVIGRVQHIVKHDGSSAWGSTTKMPWRNQAGQIIGTFGSTRDITELKQAEQSLSEEKNLLRTIIDHLPSRVFVKDTQGRYMINNAAHMEWLGVASQEAVRGRTARDFFTGSRVEQAVADDSAVLGGSPPVVNQERSDFSPEGHTHWALTTKVPFHDAEGRVAGLVGISHDITRRKQAEQELQRRSAEMEADLKMARQIQEAFFPRVYPSFPAGAPEGQSLLRFAHRYIPAATLGGDFFDVIPISESRCGVLICDVMGHGVRAGLLTALIRGVIEEYAMRTADPAAVLGEISRSLMPIVRQTGQPVFATAFFGIIDLKKNLLIHANAGHPPPFVLRRAAGSVDRLALADPEPAAGLVEGFPYSRRQGHFGPGDTLLGYTDGLFEATDAAGAQFGEDRLRSRVGAGLGKSASALVESLVGEVVSFRGGAGFEDDLCVLAVERA